MKKNEILKFEKWIYYSLIILIILCGIALRIYVYSFGRSLWLDEAALANNLMEPYSILDNMRYQQAAPPVFKLISLISLKLAGFGDYTEYALRFFPLLCGILSVPLFFMLADKLLNSRFAKIIATGLFSINYLLIYYSSEFKQYSSDVLVAILILMAGAFIKPFECSKKTFMLLASAFAASFWVSHTSLFMLAAIFLFYLLAYYKPSKIFFAKLSLLFLPSLMSFIVFYVLHLKTLAESEFMHTFWNDYFINGFSSLINVLHSYFICAFNPQKFVWGIFILILLGAVCFCRENIKYASLIGFPILILIAAAIFCVYPFSYRLCLFILPALLIFIAKPLDCLNLKKPIVLLLFTAIFCISFSSYFTIYPHIILKKNIWFREEMRPLYIYLQKVIKPDDIIVVTDQAHQADRFYQHIFKFKNEKIIIKSDRNAAKMAEISIRNNDFNSLVPGKRYWIVFTRYEDKIIALNKIVNWISNNAKVMDQYEYYSSYLFYVEPVEREKIDFR